MQGDADFFQQKEDDPILTMFLEHSFLDEPRTPRKPKTNVRSTDRFWPVYMREGPVACVRQTYLTVAAGVLPCSRDRVAGRPLVHAAFARRVQQRVAQVLRRKPHPFESAQ